MTSDDGSTSLPTDLTPQVLVGHVLDVLRTLRSDSVQCVVTSPPYWGLRAYGTEPQVWGGNRAHAHGWSATPPRRSRSAADATSAVELASVGGRNYEAQGGDSCGCGAWRGELGLEPTPDLFVSHLADVFDEVRRVLREDGTLWLNLGDSYAASPRGSFDRPGPAEVGREIEGRRSTEGFDKRAPGLKPKDLVGIPWRVAFELQRRGWWLRSDCIWAKPNPMPESVRDRPTRSHEYVFLLTKSEHYFYDADAVRTAYSGLTLPQVGATYTAEATKPYRTSGAQDPSNAKRSMIRSLEKNGGANLKSVWWIPTQPYPEAHFATYPEAHFATYPEEVVETCVRAGSRESSIVLDPFCGSGTSLWAARSLGRRSIGIELKPEYAELARKRCRAQVPDLERFGQEVPA